MTQTSVQPDVITRPALPPDLDLTLLERRPPRLSDATLRAAMELPVPVAVAPQGRPRVSIVVVTYNNLPFTKLCLTSLFGNTTWPPFELIVVDNASTDGTREYLWQLRGGTVIYHPVNKGFAPANNRGLAAAKGDVLVLLNNDTVVPPNWLPRLVAHLDDPSVGLVGPVTNRIGNEAEVETTYRTYGEMVEFAADHCRAHDGVSFEIPMPAMFCLALRRDAYERIGPLDERFEVGMLEDDDYARRARAAGYRLLCAEDAFVHHFGQASFGKLVPDGSYMRLLEANRKRFAEKWGEPWRPYGRRASRTYLSLVPRLRELVEACVPAGARTLVVSRGDRQLLDVPGRTCQHFPQDASGAYAGCYPACDKDAIGQLEALRQCGATFIVFPQTSRWWLDYYTGFARHLNEHYRAAAREDHVGVIYDLRTGEEPRG